MNMFVGLSKTFARFGRTKLGVGIRITKKNAIYMIIALLFYWMLMLCLYMMVFCIWLVYAMGYGIYWLIKKIIEKVTGNR